MPSWSQALASAAELVNWVTKQPAEHLSHLHIYRRTGFVRMLENYAGPTGLMLEGTFRVYPAAIGLLSLPYFLPYRPF